YIQPPIWARPRTRLAPHRALSREVCTFTCDALHAGARSRAPTQHLYHWPPASGPAPSPASPTTAWLGKERNPWRAGPPRLSLQSVQTPACFGHGCGRFLTTTVPKSDPATGSLPNVAHAQARLVPPMVTHHGTRQDRRVERPDAGHRHRGHTGSGYHPRATRVFGIVDPRRGRRGYPRAVRSR